MSRRYPGKPEKLVAKKCPAVKTWIVHAAHPWDRPIGKPAWCPGWTGKKKV